MPPETKTPNYNEIDQALKEFEAKSQDMPQAGVAQAASVIDETPRMVKLVMKLSGGAIKEQRQAEYVLLGVAALAILVSLYLFFGGGSQAQPLPDDDALYTPRSNAN